MMTSTDPNLGHNGGPDLEPEDDDPTGRLLFVKWAWTRAHDNAWKTPPLDILRFRVARAEAAGLTYREYMLQLLDTGRYPQAGDPGGSHQPKRPLAKPGPLVHGQPGSKRPPQPRVAATVAPAAVMADTPVDNQPRERPKSPSRPQAGPPRHRSQTLHKVHK
jgi:hypothetical protein